MRLPEFVRKVGATEDKNKVYIEDYVYSYLNGLRERKDILPVKAALYGKSFQDEKTCYCFVYGAACISDELRYGRDEEQTRRKFFDAYELIGYVTVCKDKQPFSKKSGGYYIFYESNEAMQGYLLFCSMENFAVTGQQGIPCENAYQSRRNCHDRMPWRFSKELLQKIFYGICIVIMAAALTAINDYERMNGFVELARKAVILQEQDD